MSKAEFTGERALPEMVNLYNLRQARDRLGLPPINTYIIWKQHEARYKYAKDMGLKGPLLDVACGTGYGREIVQIDDYYGVDVAHDPLQIARETVFSTQADALSLPFPDNSFQTVLSFETIEHIANNQITKAPQDTKLLEIEDALNGYCSELNRVLKPDGLAIVSTPNRDISNPDTYLTDQPNNTFHSFELTEGEFEMKLNHHFRSVTMLHQGTPRKLKMYGRYGQKVEKIISLLTGDYWKISDSHSTATPPHYLIAICTK